ncbi:MAG: GNAT family N-acetyltransferase [bacterium]
MRIPTALPTLETERLTLRPLTLEDAADVFAYASEPEVARYVPWEPHRSQEDSRQFIAGTLERSARGGSNTWAIVERASGKVIGSIRMGEVHPVHARADIGYSLGRRYWNQGLTTEAVRAVLRFGFEEVGLNRIYAVCHVANAASERVMQKVGMTYEGTLRQVALIKGGYEDRKLYAILRREWRAQQQEAVGPGG